MDMGSLAKGSLPFLCRRYCLGRKMDVKKKATIQQHLNFALFIAPALVIYVLFSIYPVLSSLFYSMTSYNGISGHYKWVFLQNFIELFTIDKDVRTAVVHNLVWAFFIMGVQNAIALFVALLLDRKMRMRNFYRSVFFLPVVLSSVAISYVWCFIYSPNIGSLNGLLNALGLHRLAVDWLGNYNLSLYSVILVDIWKSVGFYIVLFLAGLQTVPVDLMEAAWIDGASAWKRFTSVIWPFLAPTTGIVLVLCANGSLRAFDTVYLLTQEGPGDATSLFMTRLFNEAFVLNRYGYASAMAWVVFLVLLVIAWVQTRISNHEEVR